MQDFRRFEETGRRTPRRLHGDARPLTRTLLNRLGYRKGKNEDFYWKQRKCRDTKCTVQIRNVAGRLWEVNAQESDGTFNSSRVESLKELRDWEKFAFIV